MKQILKYLVDKLIEVECLYFTPQKPKKDGVLIFRKDGLGDCIVFYPFLKYFREYYHDQKITLVLPKVALCLKPLLTEFDDIIEFDNKRFSQSFFYRRRFVKTLTQKGFATAIYPVFSREPICDLIIKLTDAKQKIGFAQKNKKNEIYTELVKVPTETRLEFNRNSLLTKQITGLNPEIIFPSIDLNKFDLTAAKLLQTQYHLEPKKYIVVFPGAGAHYRIWPEERFAVICDHLADQDFIPVICGGPNDKSVAEKIMRSIKNKKTFNLTGQTDIPTLAGLLNNSLFYFGNDTGALHLATALGVPTVCLLGGGSFDRFFPYGDSKRNRYVYDHHMTCKADDWACGEKCRGDERAPCIMGIKTEDTKQVINDLIEYLNENKN